MFIKRVIISILICFLVITPVAANGDVLLSVYPHFTMPIGKDKHSINYGIGAGAKIVYRPFSFFETGIYGDYLNLNIPSITSISVFDVGVTAGYVLPLNDRFDLNFDLDAGIYKAVQKKSFNSIEVGVSASFSYKVRPSVSVGAGTSYSHYAASGTALLNGVTVSPNATFNLTEAFTRNAKIQMDTKEILPVFPVLYSWYEKNRFATVTITNEESTTIDNVKVSFYQPQYMGHQNVCIGSEERIKLNPGESIDVDLTAFFNERMLEMTEKSDTQAIVTVEYTYMGEKRTQDFAMIIPVYGRNSMSWADDRRAAVFVSSKDPAAMFYSKYVTSIIRENMRIGVPQNIQYALGIFESLSEFGVNYVIDPSSAYTDNVGTETPDFLQFPYQTLSYRGGDCDDLSILMCSLLEAVGVDTAFITVPGHIYMAFNLGLDVKQTKEQFGSLDNFIVLGDEVWVPLEITVTNEGFNRAWQIGAREWRTAERDGTAALYKMKDSWEIYKPVSVPGAAVTFTMPEKDTISFAFASRVDSWILREIEDNVNTYKKYIARTGDIKAQNTLGAIYGRYGLFDLAEEQLANPVQQGYVPAMLNAANVQFAKKNYVEAEQMYKNVIRHDRENAIAYIGVARCCYEQENFDECDLAYLKASMLDSEIVSSYTYLASFENTTGRAYNLADRLAYTIWQTDEVDLEDVIIDEAVEKRVEELREFYGSLADSLIEKTKANAEKLPKFEAITDFPLKKRDEDDDDEDYTGLPKQLAILPPDDIIGLLEPNKEIELPEIEKSAAEQIKRVKIELETQSVREVAIVETPLVPMVIEVPKAPAVIEPSAVPATIELPEVPSVIETPLVPAVVEEIQEEEKLPAVVEVVLADEMLPAVVETPAVPALIDLPQLPVVVEAVPEEEKLPAVVEVVLAEESLPAIIEDLPQLLAVVEEISVPAVIEEIQLPAIIAEETPLVPAIVEATFVEETSQVPVVAEEKLPVAVESAPKEKSPIVVETTLEEEKSPVIAESAPDEKTSPVVVESASEEEKSPVIVETALEEKIPPVVVETAPEQKLPTVIDSTSETKLPIIVEAVKEEKLPAVVEKTAFPSVQLKESHTNWLLPILIAVGGFGVLVLLCLLLTKKKDGENNEETA